MSDPSTESSRQEDIYVKALLGDKILGLAVTTKLIEKANAPLDTGSLTKVIAATVSNNFLAKHAHKVLLPSWKKLNLESLSEWEVGSLVEMAVCAVHKLDPGAVDMLAMYLLEAHSRATTMEMDTKSRLLQLGGTVRSERTGGKDHNPRFTATARLGGEMSTALGPSKKRSEMIAAAQVLVAVGDQGGSVILWNPLDANRFTFNKWEQFELVDTKISLKDGETPVEWWIRGADKPKTSFERAMMAPFVFPNEIGAVDSWVWRQGETHAAVFIVIVSKTGKCHTIPATTATTATKARKLVGIEANRAIANMVGVVGIQFD